MKRCKDCEAEIEGGVYCEPCSLTAQPVWCVAETEDDCPCEYCAELEAAL